jgi:nickel/cobalt exporter
MTRMKALVAVLVAVVTALLAPALADAHPLGNFTVNRYAGIEIAGDRVYVSYALDLAEIPTFQLGDEVRAKEFPAELARELELTIDGRRVPLRVVESRRAERPGAGGLTTLRVDVVYVGRAEGTDLRFEDRAFENRIGWREVTLSARDGARAESSSVPSASTSDALRMYPDDLLSSPLDVSAAVATVELGEARAAPPALGRVDALKHRGGGFESLIERGDLTSSCRFSSRCSGAPPTR